MAKVLVDSRTDEIRGYYKEPLDFSVSGRYVIDVPPGLYPETNVVTDLIIAKINRYKSYHPTLTNVLSDELLAVPNVDLTESSGIITGPNKRTVILPNGYIHTNSMAFVAPTTKAFIHLHGFTLEVNPSTSKEPGRLLYNYDQLTSSFFDFDPALFKIEIVDAVHPHASQYTFTAADTEESAVVATNPIRLKFTNLGTIPYHLSDWMLLYV
jgi:hypothetical protein